MRAIRAEKPAGGYAVHWLAAGDEWTFCGRRVPVLLSVERLDLVTLPSDDGCDVCEELRRRPSKVVRSDVVLPPSPGILRRTGPLYHGTRPRAGERIRFDE